MQVLRIGTISQMPKMNSMNNKPKYSNSLSNNDTEKSKIISKDKSKAFSSLAFTSLMVNKLSKIDTSIKKLLQTIKLPETLSKRNVEEFLPTAKNLQSITQELSTESERVKNLAKELLAPNRIFEPHEPIKIGTEKFWLFKNEDGSSSIIRNMSDKFSPEYHYKNDVLDSVFIRPVNDNYGLTLSFKDGQLVSGDIYDKNQLTTFYFTGNKISSILKHNHIENSGIEVKITDTNAYEEISINEELFNYLEKRKSVA